MNDADEPLVSVVITAPHYAKALLNLIASIKKQTWRKLESVALVPEKAVEQSWCRSIERDGIRVIPLSDVRSWVSSLSLTPAFTSGAWIAPVEVTDVMHPERISTLVGAAEREKADVVLDDCLIFQADRSRGVKTALPPTMQGGVHLLQDLLRKYPDLWTGPYNLPVRPLFRRRALVDAKQASGAQSLNGDAVLRLSAMGARCLVLPNLTCLRNEAGDHTTDSQEVSSPRSGAVRTSLNPLAKYSSLRGGSSSRTGRSLPQINHAAAGGHDTSQDVAGQEEASHSPSRKIYVISRQRVVGRTNGSSTYLLDLCKALYAAGFSLHLIEPSPTVFGRWPYLALGPEMQVFSTIKIRGSVRVGRLVIATDLRRSVAAVVTLIEGVLVRMGVARGNWVKPAPYSIGAPWTREDQLFLARHAQFRADGVLVDYGFLTPGIPYLLQPEARSAVVMHDMFSSRSAHFERIGAKDSVAELDLESELRLLSQADAVVAIQAAEAALVRAHLPANQVILAPMAVEPAPEPQPGFNDRVLFVGSKTAPNIDGIQWFFDEIWPIIRTECPKAELDVVGSVCDAVLSSPEGVNLLGFVDNLDDLYCAAAVVVSPLRAGSGLKVKLIEALGRGKAIVATPVTLEGVEEVTSSAVVIASDAAEIGASVVRLLKDEKIRQSYCSAALQVAVQHFSPAACYTDLVEFFREPRAILARKEDKA